MNLLFIGPPGSGKGTQSKLFQEEFGLIHLSTGDMFRQAISEKTPVGLQAKSFMDRGEYVPDTTVIELIRERLKKQDVKKGFILDGFPRTEPQAAALDSLLSELRLPLDGIIFFEVDKDILVKRLSERRTCRNCGRIVSVDQLSTPLAKEPCVKDPKKLCDFYQRDDDRADVVQNRIEVYQKQTTPVVEYYRKHKKFTALDGMQKPEDVFKQIKKTVKTAAK